MPKSNIRISRSKLGICLCILLVSINTRAQKPSKLSLEIISSHFFNSQRHSNDNGDQHLYYEFRAGTCLNKYLEVNAGAGYQLRSFIYYAQQSNGSLIPLYMHRHYIPVNANLRLYLSEFFYEKLKLWKMPGRFDIYYQLGISNLRGKDDLDKGENAFRAQGFYVPYYLYPYVQEYGKIYLTNLAGVRYNFNHHTGLFIEGGDGALMTLQIGFSVRF